jgi:hypothetical protein
MPSYYDGAIKTCPRCGGYHAGDSEYCENCLVVMAQQLDLLYEQPLTNDLTPIELAEITQLEAAIV